MEILDHIGSCALLWFRLFKIDIILVEYLDGIDFGLINDSAHVTVDIAAVSFSLFAWIIE